MNVMNFNKNRPIFALISNMPLKGVIHLCAQYQLQNSISNRISWIILKVRYVQWHSKIGKAETNAQESKLLYRCTFLFAESLNRGVNNPMYSWSHIYKIHEKRQ